MLVIDAKPFSYELTAKKPALIIIDMQRDFLEPGGFGAALGNNVSLAAACIPYVESLLKAARALNLPIIHTRECHKADLSDCPPHKRIRGSGALRIGDIGPMGRILIDAEPGNAIIPQLAPQAGELELTKPGKGAFYNTHLHDYLIERGIEDLIFAGVTTEVCVQTTMREANDRGYRCLLVEEATASYFPEYKTACINMLVAQGGIVGWAASLEQTLAGLFKAYADE
ncbi:MAG TPA: isochorismatase family cysteine hydrolase [Cellvibrionaceae bacterium]